MYARSDSQHRQVARNTQHLRAGSSPLPCSQRCHCRRSKTVRVCVELARCHCRLASEHAGLSASPHSQNRLYLIGALFAAFVIYQRHQLGTLKRVNFGQREFIEDSANGTGTQYRVLVRGSQTGGTEAAVELLARPSAVGFFPNLPASTPYHSHTEQEEAFAVLEGEMGVNLNGTIHTLKAGDVIIVQQGVPHALWCAGERPMKVRVTLTPAGRMGETFFENLAGLGATYGDVSKIHTLQIMTLFQEAGIKLEGVPGVVSWALSNVLPPFARSLGYKAAYPEYRSAAAASAKAAS